MLTVLLGVGGASASALWQQSSTATMTVTANGTWSGSPITTLTCTNDSPQKSATLRVTVPATATITYAALQANGSYGASYPWTVIPVSLTPGTIALDANSQVIKDNPATGPLTLRVTATYQDQGTASMNITLNWTSTNQKLVCPV